MSHWVHINFFPDELIELQEEVKYHPILQELLANHPMKEWEVKLAEIAVYCEVVLDGTYTEEDMMQLCKILKKRLFNMRPKESGSVLYVM